MHECKKTFKVREIDDCSGKAFNRCYGDEKLILELYFQDQDGTECYFDNWIEEEVNFCPYCGYQPERLSKRDHIEQILDMISDSPSSTNT